MDHDMVRAAKWRKKIIEIKLLRDGWVVLSPLRCIGEGPRTTKMFQIFFLEDPFS